MTTDELDFWAHAPAQLDNVIAEAVRKLIGDNEQLNSKCLAMHSMVVNFEVALEANRRLESDIANYEKEHARLREELNKTNKAPWEKTDAQV